MDIWIPSGTLVVVNVYCEFNLFTNAWISLPSLKTDPHIRPNWICFHWDSFFDRRYRESISICSVHSCEQERSMSYAIVIRSLIGVFMKDSLNSEAKLSTPQILSFCWMRSSAAVSRLLFELVSKQIFLAGFLIGLEGIRFPQSRKTFFSKEKSQCRNWKSRMYVVYAKWIISFVWHCTYSDNTMPAIFDGILSRIWIWIST